MGTRIFIPPEVYEELKWLFRDPLMMTFYAVAVFLLLFFCVRPFWQIYRSVPGGRTFQFHIPDYWAAILGLVPTFIFAADAMNTPEARRILTACVVGSCQLVGLFIGRVHNVLPPSAIKKSQWEEAGWIFLGAMFGLLLVALTVPVLFLGMLMIGLMFWLGLPVLALFLIVRKMSR